MKHQLFKMKLMIGLFLCLCACQRASLEMSNLENDAKESLLCEQNFEEFNNRLYDFWLNNKDLPTKITFHSALKRKLDQDNQWIAIPIETKESAIALAADYFYFLSSELTKSKTEPTEKLQLLTALEVGDQTGNNEELQRLWQNQKTLFQAKLLELSLPCEYLTKKQEKNKETDSLLALQNAEATLPLAIMGLRKTFSTAYQSCEAATFPALTANTPNIKGIRILSKPHKNGVGKQRVYGNVEEILDSNPYYKFEVAGTTCFKSRQQPLIYDYGGKPKASTAADSSLDFFTNSGSGTNVLGVDCSGFIFSAIARGGLRLSPNKTLKAISVNGVSARMFKNPSRNGLSCFNSIIINDQNSLEAGDIIASDGHVVMIDQVGADAFGLERAQNLSDCNEKKLNSNGFDFIIAHSSPWKNGIGINRAVAKDYLPSSINIQKGLVKYAVAFCKSRFSIQQNSEKILTITEVNVIRHNGMPDCIAPKPIALRYESCIQECPLDRPIAITPLAHNE